MCPYENEKIEFLRKLKDFVKTLKEAVSVNDEWTMRGFIDVFKNVYPMSTDTKVVSKILEIHLFPHFLTFAKNLNFSLELAEYQNWYPDLTFISNKNPDIKFAVDLKTTYLDEKNKNFCNGFTLGSHGEYFTDRTSKKNIQYPYGEYSGHFCIGVIYSRECFSIEEDFNIFKIEDLKKIPAKLKNFTFFAEEKWKIASDNQGSGNTANIGSIKCVDDLIEGRGVFSLAGEEIFNDYWVNFGKLEIPNGNGGYKKLSTLAEFLAFKGLPKTLNYPKRTKKSDVKDG